MRKSIPKLNDKDLQPLSNERPALYADRLGAFYVQQQQIGHVKSYGQYLTPPVIADFMTGLLDVDRNQPSVSIVEPGAGAGVLSCALCERLAATIHKPKTIQLVIHELDQGIIPYLEQSLQYLTKWLKAKGIKLSYTILSEDFVLQNAQVLESESSLFGQSVAHESFDFAIANPPYFKISKSDPRAKAAKAIVHGQPNIYALFMAITAKLLKPQGQMVFITPRSFTAGSYFKLFREKFFSWVKPQALHVFESRKKAFDRDKVLQENIILKAERQDN